MKYSIIIPVFNRPDEVDELLQSLTEQTVKDFDVVIVEDGSKTPCKDVVDKYASQLHLIYYYKENGGPGPARNYGVERAKGDYVLILDSDCVLPPTYIEAIEAELSSNPCDAFGGPDRAHESFTPVQKAISYSMTSFFTTGGIRGGKKKLDKFYPRSFNMGVRREFNSGIARINLEKRHPGSMKLVHLLPTAFTVGVTALIIAALVFRFMGSWMWMYALLPIELYCLLLFIDASIQNKSMVIGILAVEAAFVQLFGYGLGFIKAWWQRCVLKRGEFSAYEKNFYD